MPAERRIAVEGLHGAGGEAVQPQREQRHVTRDRARLHGDPRITGTLPAGRPSGAPSTIVTGRVPIGWIGHRPFPETDGKRARDDSEFLLSGE
ncbi:hypothetical protein GCM10023215_52000 [Pseudonocardia yuanmonensis]|uniref:Uncharacterized protein n=1 Tax=Pseudonocardia yuanmonensis TaxID=1095914 RepID=A0ABP8XGR8_9PSEU